MTTQEKILNRRLEIVLHISIWLAFILVYVVVFARLIPYEVSILRSIVNVLPMALLFYANFLFVNVFIEKRRYWAFAISTLILFFGATYLRMEANALFPDVRKEWLEISQKEGWFLGAFFTNLSFVVVGFFYQMLYNRYKTEQRSLAIINEQKEAQLQFLRAQINPHFLFNTLNNIYSLAVIKSDKTADMVLKLSNLLRYVIYDGKAEQVELKREIEHIQQFIALFQMKSEEQLNIQLSINGNIDHIKIEPMILIPIVENCFKHCDFDTNEHAFIKIDVTVEPNVLRFQTINTKNNQDIQKDKVGGVGLTNIRKRLDLKHKEDYQLKVTDHANQFTVDLLLKV